MKRLFILAAAAIVVVSNAWIIISAHRNRASPAGGTAELTERELRLASRMGDSTAVFLEL
jgi:hypothetical protein